VLSARKLRMSVEKNRKSTPSAWSQLQRRREMVPYVA
jgi:hypothetical protein